MIEIIIYAVIGIAILYYAVKWIINEHKEWQEFGDLLGKMYLNSCKYEGMLKRKNKR